MQPGINSVQDHQNKIVLTMHHRFSPRRTITRIFRVLGCRKPHHLVFSTLRCGKTLIQRGLHPEAQRPVDQKKVFQATALRIGTVVVMRLHQKRVIHVQMLKCLVVQQSLPWSSVRNNPEVITLTLQTTPARFSPDYLYFHLPLRPVSIMCAMAVDWVNGY